MLPKKFNLQDIKALMEPLSSKALEEIIYKACKDIFEGIVTICLKVKLDGFCVSGGVVGVEIAELCGEYESDGNIVRATVNPTDVSTGTYKFVNIISKVEHDFDTQKGRVTLNATLLAFSTDGFKYIEKRKWEDEEIASW